MPGLLIIAHAPLASSLKAVAEHAYPDCAVRLAALDVRPDVPVEEVEAQARQMLERLATPELLIFTDVFGATPSNIAQRLADGVRIKVVTGSTFRCSGARSATRRNRSIPSSPERSPVRRRE